MLKLMELIQEDKLFTRMYTGWVQSSVHRTLCSVFSVQSLSHWKGAQDSNLAGLLLQYHYDSRSLKLVLKEWGLYSAGGNIEVSRWCFPAAFLVSSTFLSPTWTIPGQNLGYSFPNCWYLTVRIIPDWDLNIWFSSTLHVPGSSVTLPYTVFLVLEIQLMCSKLELDNTAI